VFEFSSSLVVQSSLGKYWTLDASNDSSPLMRSSCLTGFVFLVHKLSSEEIACLSVFPHVVCRCSTSTDLASWESLRSEGSWEAPLFKEIERSADFWAKRNLWLNWDLSTISDPFSTLESVPVVSVVLEYPAVVMPESLIPGPAIGGESSLGWAPVVPLVVIPSIPDLA